MTTQDIITHWRTRAKETMRVAHAAHDVGSNADALFHCHLAIERALKASIMEQTGKPHPKIHDLLSLANLLKKNWNEDETELYDALSDFAVAARYDDPEWAKKIATDEVTLQWLKRTEQLLSHLIP